MRSTDLEQILRSQSIAYEREAKVNGSLVDYLFHVGPVRVVVIVRQTSRVEDAYYLKGVGDANDIKVLVIQEEVDQGFAAQVKKMGVMAVESKYILDLPSLATVDGLSATRLDLAKSLSSLTTGDRLLVLIFSCWKELLLILLLGFLLAQLFSGEFLNMLREVGKAIHGQP